MQGLLQLSSARGGTCQRGPLPKAFLRGKVWAHSTAHSSARPTAANSRRDAQTAPWLPARALASQHLGWGCVPNTLTYPMSEAEMDNYTIRGLREEARAAGRPPKPLVSLRPQDSLHAVIGKLFRNRCSMAPVLSASDVSGAPFA